MAVKRVLIIGGYGNFGRFISQKLAAESGLQIIIAGRSETKARFFAEELSAVNKAEAYRLDIDDNLLAALQTVKPDIVVHTSGPFQNQQYTVAQACIEIGAHYIDLADAREFVANFSMLDHVARTKDVLLVSGASSVPALSAAVIDAHLHHFQVLEEINYAISTAQKTTRGLATTTAILGYTGQPFFTLQNGSMKKVFGLQGLRLRHYRALGWRLLGLCNIPDLVLFPERYPTLKTQRFYAGLELKSMQFMLWCMAGLVRIGLLSNLKRFAEKMLKLSFLFDRFGGNDSAFHMDMKGRNQNNENIQVNFELSAFDGHGPLIPCIPAIYLVKALASGALSTRGAQACVGLISLEDYLAELQGLHIQTRVEVKKFSK